jgi:hypothetical protein
MSESENNQQQNKLLNFIATAFLAVYTLYIFYYIAFT